jgi:hypothetical protein
MLLLTLLIVQRPRNNTVTEGIPVLVPCGPEEQEGLATFLPELATPQPVRVVTDAEFKSKRGLYKALSTMEDYEREQFRAVGSLLSALQADDQQAVVRARQYVAQAYAHVAQANALKKQSDSRVEFVPAQEDNLEFGRTLIRLYGLQPGQEKKATQRWNGYCLGPKAGADDGWLLSQLMSEGLASVRLVLWWSGKGVRPAIYCPDLRTAVYTFLLTKKWGVCPQCGDFFIQNRPDQNYCTIAHREAHRVARWRAAKASQSKKKGGPNGTRKTR